MTKLTEIVFIGFIITFLSNTPAFSQNYPNWALGARGGLTTFYGDLANYDSSPFQNFTFQNNSKPMFGIFLERAFNPYFAMQLRSNYGKVYGENNDLQQSFEATLWDINLSGLFDITNSILGARNMRRVSLYALAGFGFANWRSVRHDVTTNDILGRNGSKSAGMTNEGEILLGLGININFSPNFFLNLESTIHGINTDKLDSYIDGLRTVEGFGYTSIGLGYRFTSGNYSSCGKSQFGHQSDRTVKAYWGNPKLKSRKGNPVKARKSKTQRSKLNDKPVISPGDFH